MKILKILIAWMLLAGTALTGRAATEDLRIMTYNIPMGNIDPSEGNGQNTWGNRAIAIQQYLNNVHPDLLGMQEPVRAELIDILVGIPGYAMVGTGRDDGADKGEYTPIIYRTDRFYVEANGNYWLTDTPTVHSRIEGSSHFRIATWAVLVDKKTGARFMYTNTHLSYDSQPVRLAQIKILKTHMLETLKEYGEKMPCFITGDMNMKDDEDNYTYLMQYQVIMKDMWTSAKKRVDYNLSPSARSGRIDYIFGSQKVYSRLGQWDNKKTINGYIMSDHDPLWADVYWTLSNEDVACGLMADAWNQIDSTLVVKQSHTKLITSSSQLTMDAIESSEGNSVSYMLDTQTSTYAQSLYSKTAPNNPHYVQVMLRKTVSDFFFSYHRRPGSTEGKRDRWQDVMITASNDLKTWDYITEIYDFGGPLEKYYTSGNIALRKPYRYVRFNVMRTPGEVLCNGHPQFSVGELQMYAGTLDETCEYSTFPRVAEAVDSLQKLIAETKDVWLAGGIKKSHCTDLQEGIDALLQARADAADAIDLVYVSDEKKSAEHQIQGIYDLSGHRMERISTPGVYIVDGKKIYVR